MGEQSISMLNKFHTISEAEQNENVQLLLAGMKIKLLTF